MSCPVRDDCDTDERPAACDPSPHAPRCEPDPAPVFAATWRPVPGSMREPPRLLDEDIAVTLGRLAAACRPRARLVRYPGRPGEPEDYPAHLDLAGAAGGRAWEEPIELQAFDTLEPS